MEGTAVPVTGEKGLEWRLDGLNTRSQQGGVVIGQCSHGEKERDNPDLPLN